MNRPVKALRRADIVDAARRWVGTPYRHQASNEGIACDCLGLARGVWRELIGTEPELIPAYSADWAEASGRETLLEGASRHFVRADKVRAGSLLLFRWRRNMPAKHVGIAVGEAHFIHAYDRAGRVLEGGLVPMWRRRLAGIFDYPGVID